jgi:hypothetical protein
VLQLLELLVQAAALVALLALLVLAAAAVQLRRRLVNPAVKAALELAEAVHGLLQ